MSGHGEIVLEVSINWRSGVLAPVQVTRLGSLGSGSFGV